MKIIKCYKLSDAIWKCVVHGCFLAYIIMLVFWAVTGFKYGIEQCGKLLLICMPAIIVLFLAIICIIMADKYITLIRLRRCRLNTGADRKYFRLLKKYLGGLHSVTGVLYYAYCLAESGKYRECLNSLKKLKYNTLFGADRINYSNTVLYCAVLSGNQKLAEETYMRCSGFLYNGATYKGNEHLRLTLGLYALSHGDVYMAENYLKSAAGSKKKDIRCKALLTLSQIYIDEENFGKCRSCIIGASKCLMSLEQCVEIRRQMLAVQNFYGINNFSGVDNRKENCYDT